MPEHGPTCFPAPQHTRNKECPYAFVDTNKYARATFCHRPATFPTTNPKRRLPGEMRYTWLQRCFLGRSAVCFDCRFKTGKMQ